MNRGCDRDAKGATVECIELKRFIGESDEKVILYVWTIFVVQQRELCTERNYKYNKITNKSIQRQLEYSLLLIVGAIPLCLLWLS